MSDKEIIDNHPIWEGAVVGLLGAVEQGMLSRDQIIPAMAQVCKELLESEMLANLGVLQQYLRQHEAIVQLVARPFKLEDIPRSDMRCIDIVTHEPRGHWLIVSVGHHEAAMQLQALAVSNEVNEYRLTNDTGMLAVET